MAKFFKRLFAWWDGATLGTLLQIARKGTKIGSDDYGNTYFEEKGSGYDGRKRRWVTYKGYADASRVPSEWHGWLHHMFDAPPTVAPTAHYAWEKQHRPNMTGTVHAYKPKGSLDRGGKRDRVLGDYEAWKPDA
ncbi:NADH:ubiquinone oxidoreductase subunit NDUFA12 [Robiginitomaculum antarcticum]|uniref:NADH:ubiquinone oxidoreductase subunit NDUFA12 n=1 Tax=Robiginitomaculum antarcticum TaxID=437507 RepID=UPI0003767C40|nr:NADH:ubiquinone oxidoreductase subunit NDUFA12 [Robiginitomaculum antarcticum]